ncbi:hypothetical protein HN018_06685 [Lichenicola cladoniae]|uniref:Uncharacterized protein n=1 Tax=Lichenicola cladoniae TaxID=1484109 RepID=A0A6M8HMX1_9PROT|nr:hypothetical protein [Lichenicola cladoniae]NPD67258.1 hypothetical protein [Acetobacteraceae bacterium]QKE89763.1 hypothetical protein HN018_06685 [Lichenicola cladoniae]
MSKPELIKFGTRWELDGDYLRCRICRRPQIVSRVMEDFQHASGCAGSGAESNPWKTLASPITAQIAKATTPDTDNSRDLGA